MGGILDGSPDDSHGDTPGGRAVRSHRAVGYRQAAASPKCFSMLGVVEVFRDAHS